MSQKNSTDTIKWVGEKCSLNIPIAINQIVCNAKS
jgi:hypothetical protein